MDNSPSKNFTILLADDNESQRKALSLIISHKGYSVVSVSTGRDVQKALDRKKPDMILMDITLPISDSIGIARSIKAGNPDIAVVLMTGYSFEDLVKESIEMSRFCIIFKPFNTLKISRMIDEHKKSKIASLVILVDQEDETCSTQEKILQEQGFETGRAFSSDGAIELLQAKRLDVIFVDVVLPLLSCLEVFSEFKKLKSDIVAVVTTAYREETSDIIHQSLSRSVHACIYKPFEIGEIVRLIEEVRKVKRLRQSE